MPRRSSLKKRAKSSTASRPLKMYLASPPQMGIVMAAASKSAEDADDRQNATSSRQTGRAG